MKMAASASCTAPMIRRRGPVPALRGTIHWVEAKTAVPIRIREYDYLYVENEAGEMVLNPDSKREITALAEPSVAEAQPGESFQFFRHGYYIADVKETTEKEKVFNSIVGLKSSFKIKKK